MHVPVDKIVIVSTDASLPAYLNDLNKRCQNIFVYKIKHAHCPDDFDRLYSPKFDTCLDYLKPYPENSTWYKYIRLDRATAAIIPRYSHYELLLQQFFPFSVVEDYVRADRLVHSPFRDIKILVNTELSKPLYSF